MWSYSSRPPDPMLVGDAWANIWTQRLKAEPFLPIKWLNHQTRDNYWKHGSICENYDGIQSAVLAIGGWGDAYKNAVSHLVSNIKSPVKGVVGPWVHKYPHFAVPEPKIGFLQELSAIRGDGVELDYSISWASITGEQTKFDGLWRLISCEISVTGFLKNLFTS